MKTDYAATKFGDAIHALATRPERITERLVEAVTLIASLNVDECIPDDLASDFNDLLRPLGLPTDATASEDQIHSAMRNMTEAQAVEIAEQIMVLALELEGAVEQERDNPR